MIIPCGPLGPVVPKSPLMPGAPGNPGLPGIPAIPGFPCELPIDSFTHIVVSMLAIMEAKDCKKRKLFQYH